MKLFMHELKSYQKSLLFWCIGSMFLVIATMTEYGTYSDNQQINELIKGMPKSLQALIGSGDLDLSKAIDYFGVIYLYLLVMGAIHALMLGASIISKEEAEKTADFLFVKPITRARVVTIKLSAVFVNIIVFNFVTFATAYMSVQMHTDSAGIFRDVLTLMIGLLLLQYLFMGAGAAIAAGKKKPKSATGMGTAIVLLLFILSILIDINSSLEVLKHVNPFKYFVASDLIHGGELNVSYVIISVLATIIFVVLAYLSYNKRDLQA
ncbi:ABC transporter [Bacillus sp. HMF5848]|uniref:ABC transporter permease subunit n=1 Tax=Bacillus sp. HMF5848 TaxID=2495421 RepID=UPI000F79D7D5|nr:ABC transporter permease subunit [Bacillus sp. HMF5848]RSK26048.1 ABC transporter [Bacillus sp. HMF5848]